MGLDWTLALAQVAGGQLDGITGYARVLVAAGFALVAGGSAFYAANARTLSQAIGLFAVGLLVAGAMGFLFYDGTAALLAASLYLMLASAAQVYVLERSTSEIGLWGILALVGLGLVLAFTDPKTGAFLAAALVIVYSSLKTLQAQRLVHATIWLAGMLVGVAGIFLSLGAEFLAAIQILVYVGAVITLFLFTVMLTVPDEDQHGLDDVTGPPGIAIETLDDLNPAIPAYGHGPYKSFPETNPRKPVRAPPTLYGVHIADGVLGSDDTIRRKTQKDEEGK